MIPFIYTAVFAVILVNVVPRREIKRLFIYGLIFGGVADVLLLQITVLLNEFKYINYGNFGQFGLHFMAPISWTIFFIIYFHFLPQQKVYQYIYVFTAVFYSMLFCQMLTRMKILELRHGIIDSIIPFVLWFPAATWGYNRLTQNNRRQRPEPSQKSNLPKTKRQ